MLLLLLLLLLEDDPLLLEVVDMVFSPVDAFRDPIGGLSTFLPSVLASDRDLDLVGGLLPLGRPRRLSASSPLFGLVSFLDDRRFSSLVLRRNRWGVEHISHIAVIIGSEVIANSRTL